VSYNVYDKYSCANELKKVCLMKTNYTEMRMFIVYTD
jgi:hypothetical protein